MPVDKQVTIALQVEDELTTSFRRAAAEADALATKVDRVSRVASQVGDSGGIRTLARSMRDTTGEATRLERAMVRAGGVTKSAFVGADRGLGPLRQRMDDAADAADRASRKYQAMSDAGRSVGVAGLAMAAGMGAGVKMFADFDKAMSAVAANTQATGSTLAELRSTAIRLGADTQFSGTEAAQGLNELAKAGVTARDSINGGLQGALNLAAAGQMDVAEAAEIAASAMTQFGLSGRDVPHVADLLAAAANKAQGSVHDMGQALNQVGLVAKGTGLSIEDTVGGLTAFAAAGMVGSDAGTSMKTMLQRLTPASEEAAKMMEALGLSAFDSRGEFVGLATYAGRLQKSMAGLSPQMRAAAMNTLFGADAVRAANILYREGESGIKRWTEAINAAGFAQRNAAALTNNLAGDWEKLGGAISGVVLQSGGGVNEFLRGMVQGATAAVDAVGSLPPELLSAGAGLGAVATAATLAGGGLLFVVPKAMAAYAALQSVSIGATTAAASLRVLGVAAGALALGVVAESLEGFAARAQVTRGETDQLSQSLRGLAAGGAEGSSAFTRLMDNHVQLFNRTESSTEAVKKFGETAAWATMDGLYAMSNRMFDIQGNTQKFEERVRQLDTAFAQMVRGGSVTEANTAFEQLMTSVQQQGGDVEKVRGMFGQYAAALDEAGSASARLSQEQQLAASATLGMSDAQLKSADSAKVAAELTTKFKDAVANLGNEMLSQRDAARGFEAALDTASEAAEKNGRTLDITSAKGRDNQAALDAVASSGMKAAAGIYQSTGSLTQAAAAAQHVRNNFVQTAQSFGMSSTEANRLADQLGLTADSVVQLASSYGQVPQDVTTFVQAQGLDQARDGVEQFLYTAQQSPPPMLLAPPDTSQFAQGMTGAMDLTDQLDRQSPQVDVTSSGVPKFLGDMSNVLGVSKEADAQAPNVSVSQSGAQAAQGQIKDTTSAAKEYDRQNPSAHVSVTGTDTVRGRIQGVITVLRTMARTWTANIRSSVGFANGGVWPGVQAFADGGVTRRERHVAQIAPAGAWRVWAEDETGGEAYIPLARAKRRRSVSILEEVARRFGMSLIRQAEGGVMRFASGGTTVPVTESTALVRTVKGTGLTLPVTAQITKVTIPKGVKAPFLYTPGGKWDTSTQRGQADTQAISSIFRDRWVTKEKVAAELAKVRDARAAAGLPRDGSMDKVAASTAKLTGALKAAPAQIRTLITQASAKHGVSANLIAAVVQKESNFKTTARSRAGAQGLMQLMPGTARSLGVRNPLNAAQNIDGGVKYLAQQLKTFGGNIEKALAAYNAGPGNVRKYGGIPPFRETQNYVRSILADPGVKTTGGYVANTAAARAAGKSAGTAVAASQKAMTTQMAATVKAKTDPVTARSAAIANALSMNGRGKYVWGGGHQAGYYKNAAALAADCSGFVGWAIGRALGKNVTGVSTSMLRGGSLGYVKIDPKIAAKTAGALMGSVGHIVMSLGDGRVIESYTKGKPVRIRKLASRDMSMASWNKALGPMTQATAAQVTGGLAGVAGVGGAADPKKLGDLATAQKAYADALAASKIPARTTFAQATQSATRVSSQFLAYIRKIRDRGFPEVAYQLLMMGEDNGGLETAASFAAGSDKELRNQRANFQASEKTMEYADDLRKALGTVAGRPAWETAKNQATKSTNEWTSFLSNVDKVAKRGFPTLAARLLDMGVEEGSDIARQAVTLADVQLRALRNSLVNNPDTATDREAKLRASLGPKANVALTTEARKANVASKSFLDAVAKLSARGYSALALHYMETGEDTAGEAAKAAADATDATNTDAQRVVSERDQLEKRAEQLKAELEGWGKTITATPGLATGSDPRVRWDAPRVTAGMPTPARVAQAASRTGTYNGPLVQVETVNAVDEDRAARALATRIGDAIATDSLRLAV